MASTDETRRRFMTQFTALGFGSTLVPGIVWARMQDAGADRITLDMAHQDAAGFHLKTPTRLDTWTPHPLGC